MGNIDYSTTAAECRYLIALGSNLGVGEIAPAEVLERALKSLQGRGFAVRSQSRFFQTPAFPAGAGPDFVNAAAVLEAQIDPVEVLAQLHAVEAELSRTREVRWSARTLDLDLIAAGDLVLPDAKTHQYWRKMPLEMQRAATPEQLILPHPRLAERAFVLVPLLDVVPDWRHPVTGLSIREMHDALPEAMRYEVRAL
ncbi:2-amino-4-hydroxy-6-hydroxymethyldihydropteridine diphosphokinase [Sulfitobacter sp.]|uniref:2-amino-4-hydroxy-6- hydroxymethyldihydropteridine diphosphokinase n=1 Tax=Sulfitobacter sp. TaxID=1903071 RepID=UPI00300268EA